jgi:Tol biopolymer transport system component
VRARWTNAAGHDHTRFVARRGVVGTAGRFGLASVMAVMAALCTCREQSFNPWEPVREAVAEHPTWTPDGSSVLYKRGGRIWSVDMQGNTTCISERWPYYTDCPDVSPDGNWLLFVTGGQTYKARLSQDGVIDTATIVPLTDRGLNYNPDWSPDGNRIAYDSDVSGDSTVLYGICFMDADGGNKKRKCDPAGARDPDWSPDGSRVVYLGYVGYAAGDIVVSDTNGLNCRALTRDSAIDCDPDWSPDGSRIAFSRYPQAGAGRNPGFRVCLIDTAGEGIEAVTTGWRPAWAPDGQRLAFEDVAEDERGRRTDYSTVFVIDLRSGERRQLVWR